MGMRALVVLLAAVAQANKKTHERIRKGSPGSGAQVDAADGSPWQPSAQQLRRGVPRDDEDWFGAMAGELRKSLNDTRFGKRAMPQDAMKARNLLRHILMREKLRDGLILVLGGRLYSTHQYLHADKAKKHLLLLAAIQRRFGRLPNVFMIHETSSAGICYYDKRLQMIPTTVIAKRGGYQDCGVLVPNPYFGRGDVGTSWAATIAELQEASKAVKERIPRVFWRGAVDNHDLTESGKYPCEREWGNYARLESLALTREHPELFDSKCNTLCAPRDQVKHPCKDLPYDETMSKMISNNMSNVRDSVMYGERDYANYKYVLNLPGKTDGSYSRNLNHLWAVGSAVLLWDGPVVEWLYPALKHGETHASVSRSSAKAVVDDLQNSPMKYKRLVEGAQRVQRELVSPEGLDRYMRIVVNELRKAQSQNLILDAPEDVASVFDGLDCSKLGLMETFVIHEHSQQRRYVEVGHRKVTDCQKFVNVTRWSQSVNDKDWLEEIKRDLKNDRDLRYNLTHSSSSDAKDRLLDLEAEHAAHRMKIREVCTACAKKHCSVKTLEFCRKASRGYDRITRIPQHHNHDGRRLQGRGTYAVARAAVFRNKWWRFGMMCLDVVGLVIAAVGVGGLLYVFREFSRTFDDTASGRRKRANSIDSSTNCYL